jgi:hypothetical protein
LTRLISAKFGEVAEWLKAHAWKVCLGLNLTRVRIPLSPPNLVYTGSTDLDIPTSGV